MHIYVFYLSTYIDLGKVSIHQQTRRRNYCFKLRILYLWVWLVRGLWSGEQMGKCEVASSEVSASRGGRQVGKQADGELGLGMDRWSDNEAKNWFCVENAAVCAKLAEQRTVGHIILQTLTVLRRIKVLPGWGGCLLGVLPSGTPTTLWLNIISYA